MDRIVSSEDLSSATSILSWGGWFIVSDGSSSFHVLMRGASLMRQLERIFIRRDWQRDEGPWVTGWGGTVAVRCRCRVARDEDISHWKDGYSQFSISRLNYVAWERAGLWSDLLIYFHSFSPSAAILSFIYFNSNFQGNSWKNTFKIQKQRRVFWSWTNFLC